MTTPIIPFKPTWVDDGPKNDPVKICSALNGSRTIAIHPSKPSLADRSIPHLVDLTSTFEWVNPKTEETRKRVRFTLLASILPCDTLVEDMENLLDSGDKDILMKNPGEIDPRFLVALFDQKTNLTHMAVPWGAVKMPQKTENMIGLDRYTVTKTEEFNRNLFWILPAKTCLALSTTYLGDEFAKPGVRPKQIEKAILNSFLEGNSMARLTNFNGQWFPKLPSWFFFQHIPEISSIELTKRSAPKKPQAEAAAPAPSSSSSPSSSSLPIVKKKPPTAFNFDGNDIPPAPETFDDVEETSAPPPPPPRASKKRTTRVADDAEEVEDAAPKRPCANTADQSDIAGIIAQYFDWKAIMTQFSQVLDNDAIADNQRSVELAAKLPKPKLANGQKIPPIACRQHIVPDALSPDEPLSLVWWAQKLTVESFFSEDIAKKWQNTLPGKFENPTQPFSQALLYPTTHDYVPTGPPLGDTSGHYLMAMSTASYSTQRTLDIIKPILDNVRTRLQGCYETTLATFAKSDENIRRKTSENTQLKKEIKVLHSQLEEANDTAKTTQEEMKRLQVQIKQLKKDLEDAKNKEPEPELGAW